MINAGTVAAFLTLDTEKFDKGIKGANAQLLALGDDNMKMRDKLKGVGSALTDIGRTMTTHVTLPLAGAGLAALNVAANFDEGMSKVAAISGATGDELDALRDKAREMGAKTKFSATEAADAMSYMAMAGWKTEEMLGGIEGIMSLAAASGEDLATTSDIVTDALTAFGLKAKDSGHFADVLAAASSNANTNVSLMGETFKYVAPVAGALGISAEDTALATGLMANAGIKASQAGTALRSIFTRLSTDAGASANGLGALGILTEKLGVQFYDSEGKVRDFGDVLNEAREKWKTLSAEDSSLFAQKIAGKNGISGWLALMNASAGDVDKLASAIENCDGTAAKMAETMQGNLKGQLTILKSQTEELAISIGSELMPYANSAVSAAQGLVDKFNSLDSGSKRLIVNAGLVAAAIGPVSATLGKVNSGIGALITSGSAAKAAFTAAGGGIAGFGKWLATLITPSGLVVAGLAAVALAGIAIYHDFHRAKDKLKEFNDVMEKSAETSEKIDEITTALENLKQARLENYASALGEITTVEHLSGRLDELVDDNGKLIGSKEELQSVVQQLNSKGFTVELNKTGDLVKNYKDLKNEVAKYVEQKKAQAMLDALEPDYQNALKEKAHYYSVYSESIGEAVRLQKLLSDEEYVQGLSVKEYEDLANAYTELSGKANEAFSSYQSACNVIDAYDKSMAAIAKGDFEVASELLAGYYEDIGTTIKKKSDYAKEEQEKAITELSEQFKQHIQAYGAAMKIGDETVINDAKTYLEQAATELEAAGVKLPEGLVEGIEDGSIGYEEAVQKTVKASENAVEGIIKPFNTQSLQDRLKAATTEYVDIIPETAKKGLKENSPSRVMMEIGGFAAVGLINGVLQKKLFALTAIKSTMDGMVTVAKGVRFTSVGTGVINGVLAGFNAKKNTLLSAARGIASSISNVMKNALKINSPSKVTMAIGESVTEGMELGMNKGKDSLYRTASDISLDTAEALAGASQARYNYQTPATDYGDRLDRLLDAVERLVASEPVMQIDGRPFGRLVRSHSLAK